MTEKRDGRLIRSRSLCERSNVPRDSAALYEAVLIGKTIKKIKLEEYMKYLIVVAHPDDEVLGAGASICKRNKIK